MNLILKIIIIIIALAIVLLYFLPGSPFRILNYENQTQNQNNVNQETGLLQKIFNFDQSDDNNQNTDNNGLVSGCGIDIEISGGKFSPDWCEFQIISPGAACDLDENNRPISCQPDFALGMRDSNRSHVETVSLFNFKSLTTGVYKFNLGDFNGQLIDDQSTFRAIESGTVTMERKGDYVDVTFDIIFTNNIKVSGRGNNISVTLQNAP